MARQKTKTMRKVIALLTVLVSVLQRLARRKEQEDAQNERDKIDSDSAQYSADTFGDGRVRDLEQWKSGTDEADQSDDRGR